MWTVLPFSFPLEPYTLSLSPVVWICHYGGKMTLEGMVGWGYHTREEEKVLRKIYTDSCLCSVSLCVLFVVFRDSWAVVLSQCVLQQSAPLVTVMRTWAAIKHAVTILTNKILSNWLLFASSWRHLTVEFFWLNLRFSMFSMFLFPYLLSIFVTFQATNGLFWFRCGLTLTSPPPPAQHIFPRVWRLILNSCYRPQRSCEGYVLTRVCLSTGGGEVPGQVPPDQVHPGTRYTSLGPGIPLDQVPSLGPGTPPVETATVADGTHPTEMHSC